MKPKVSILIVHINGEDILENCLKTISKTTYPNFEIHLLLNSTTDNSEKIAKKYNTIIYKCKERMGYSRAFNFLVKKVLNTDSKYIISINNDTEVEPTWLSELVKFAEENNADMCQPKILSLRDKKMFEYAGGCGGFMDKYGYPFCRGRIFSTLEEDKGQYDKPRRIFWACGSCALYKKDLFKKIGLLDEDFFIYAEETDFCWRANIAGAKLFSVPSSVIYHLGSYTIKTEKLSKEKEYYLHRNTMIMFFKNYSDANINKLKIKRMMLELLSAVVFFRQKLIPVTKALRWISKNKEVIIKKHDEIQTLRKVSDDELKPLMLDGSIAYSYFVKGKKKFSDLKIGGENGETIKKSI